MHVRELPPRDLSLLFPTKFVAGGALGGESKDCSVKWVVFSIENFK